MNDESYEQQEINDNDSDIEEDEDSENTEISQTDKINAIYDMLDDIKECKQICEFLIYDRWFQNAYEWYIEKSGMEVKTKQVKSVFDFYGIPMAALKNSSIVYDYPFVDKKHINIVREYYAMENISYDPDRFIYQPKAYDKAREAKQDESARGQNTGNTQRSYRPPTA